MNINSIKAFIEKTWDESAIPALKDYIAIPAVSPFFAPDWKSSGFLTDALWLKGMALENARIQILSPEDRTPVLLVEIEASGPVNKETLLLYGHLDKQPPAPISLCQKTDPGLIFDHCEPLTGAGHENLSELC